MLNLITDYDTAFQNTEHPSDRSDLFKKAFSIIAHTGDSWYWIIGLAAVWIFIESPYRNFAITTAIYIFITASIVNIIKFTVRRERPDAEWGELYRIADPHSFPSGHAARASMLSILALYFFGVAVFIPMVFLAVMVAYSRAALRVHFLSDVSVGLLIGLIVGSSIFFVL